MTPAPRDFTAASLRAALVRRAFHAPAPPGPAGLLAAVERLGFVQLDPIRAPARAQDLILRHRVDDYRAGDLERDYPALGLDEDVVYAYGIVSPATRRLLHPRGGAPAGVLEGLHARVLTAVRKRGPTHPRDLIAKFGAAQVVNAWGGQSRSTTRALEHLHYWGYLRVARRDAGVRVYEAVPKAPARARRDTPAARFRAIVLLVARIFGPLPEPSLRGLLRLSRFAVPDVADRAAVVRGLLADGALERGSVDGEAYVWATGAAPNEGLPDERDAVGDERVVRLLAPFDPLVWDRRRLEQLWGWPYRFEAYTPVAKRQFGYYALPLLWGDALIGWANVGMADGALDVSLGFVTRRPRDRAFTRALDAEIARVERFLGA